MNVLKHFSLSGYRLPMLFGCILLFLQACSTYSPSRGYQTRSYSYQPQVSSFPRHGYYGHGYYGSYQPGWFIHTGYPGGYNGAWGYAPLAYWPSYRPYYRNDYYPYYDPWYHSYSSRYRNFYGYGYGYVPGYRYGSPYGYGYKPYYGPVHSYRPPSQEPQPPQNRPDPVVIPPSERGRRRVSDGYDPRNGEAIRQSGSGQSDRRSVTVVNQEQDLSRSVGVAPTQAGDQGMTISSRSERKVRASRLEPNGPPSPPPRAVNQLQPEASVVVPSTRSVPAYRQAPARQQPPSNQPRQQPPSNQPRPEPRQQPAARSQQPSYQQRPGPSNVIPRADRRPARDTERQREG